MNAKPYYPVGIQSFEKLRRLNALYVDKTELVHKLVSTSTSVFLSRPRRFGKSLLSSTLACYFEGRKELFAGLAVERLETEWVQHPVFHFDLSTAKNKSLARMAEDISAQLDRYEKIYGDKYASASLGTRLSMLITQAYEQTGRRVVVIIDEYDAPILGCLHNPDQMQELRGELREFFAPLKANDCYLRFVFITGISAFSQLSIFSELNNLKIISDSDEYAAICGITQQELEDNFQYGINDLAERSNCSAGEMIAMLKQQYDGYHFSKSCIDVYNPFSLLNAFDSGDMAFYWFASGTPTFLIEMLKKYQAKGAFDLDMLDSNKPVSSGIFTKPLEEYSGPIPLLYQAGYLTIKRFVPNFRQYILGIPNTEVRVGLLQSLLPLFSGVDQDEAGSTCDTASAYLREGNCEEALNLLKALLASILFMHGTAHIFESKEKTEAYYHRFFYFFFKMLHREVEAECRSSRGAADIIVKTPKFVYIFEIKINSSPEIALRQIEEKGYATPFLVDSRQLIKVGINCSTELRTLDRWTIA